jgi:type IV pilus assembly protein PilV
MTLKSDITKQRGFNMVEVMVALAVLSFGLLGLAALQATGLRFNTTSYQRTQAVFQTYDLIDRIRANAGCVPLYILNRDTGSKDLVSGQTGCEYDSVSVGEQPAGPDCISSDGSQICANPNDMAAFDVRQWNERNALILNQGQGAVCRGTLTASVNPPSFSCVTTTESVYSIAIFWIENDLSMRLDTQVEL